MNDSAPTPDAGTQREREEIAKAILVSDYGKEDAEAVIAGSKYDGKSTQFHKDLWNDALNAADALLALGYRKPAAPDAPTPGESDDERIQRLEDEAVDAVAAWWTETTGFTDLEEPARAFLRHPSHERDGSCPALTPESRPSEASQVQREDDFPGVTDALATFGPDFVVWLAGWKHGTYCLRDCQHGTNEKDRLWASEVYSGIVRALRSSSVQPEGTDAEAIAIAEAREWCDRNGDLFLQLTGQELVETFASYRALRSLHPEGDGKRGSSVRDEGSRPAASSELRSGGAT